MPCTFLDGCVESPPTVLLSLPHFVCVDSTEQQCDRDAPGGMAMLAKAFRRRSWTVQEMPCSVPRLRRGSRASGDCNRADQPNCTAWQQGVFAAARAADVFLDVHSSNERRCYTLTPRGSFHANRNWVQKAIDRAGVEARQGSTKNYLIESTAYLGHCSLIEFSIDPKHNEIVSENIATEITKAWRVK